MERAEGGGAEGFERVESGEDGVGVLEDKGSGLDAQVGLETFVAVCDLDLGGAKEGCGGLEGEGEKQVGGEIVLIAELDGRVRDVSDALVEQREVGTRRSDGDGQGQRAAVLEGTAGGQLVACMEFGGGDAEGKGETERLGAGGVGVGERGEGQVGEVELLDLIEAGSGEHGGGVVGVQFESFEGGRLRECVGGYADGLPVSVLMHDDIDGAGICGFEGKSDVDGIG